MMAVKLGWAKEENGIFQANTVEKMGIFGNFRPANVVILKIKFDNYNDACKKKQFKTGLKTIVTSPNL
jgi:hypothetical protein